MPDLYPIICTPVLKNYIWGGRNLTGLGRVLPAGQRVAESWEIAAHPDGMSTVENGPYAGQTLQALTEQLGEALVGTRGAWALSRNRFPLLVKLLDANHSLSVQVHPDDAYAQQHTAGDLGKAEMWVVLRADPQAAIIYGFEKEITPEQLRAAIKAGKLEASLNRIPVKAGDHICIPAGTVHALLDGAVVAEIQQNSNTTYRVYDWNRVGGDGKPRELHVQEALQVINFKQIGMGLPKPKLVEKTEYRIREGLCRNPYFAVERVSMKAGAGITGECNGETLEIWGVINGSANVAGTHLEAVRFILLPAGLGPFKVETLVDSVLLRAYLT